MGVQQDHTVFREINPARRLEEERALFEQRLTRMEADMRAVFNQKVHEKEQKLKNSEAELFRKHKEMKEQLGKQRAELEARKAKLEEARAQEEKKTTRKGFLNR
jgi:septin 7